jgi:prophage regulatory protein
MIQELREELKNIKTNQERLEKLLLAKKNVLNIRELSDYTGYSISYIYKLTSRNAIPYFKPSGKAVFFDRMEIDVWLLKNKHSQIKDDGGLIGNEWQKDIPDYWKDFKPVNYLKDE